MLDFGKGTADWPIPDWLYEGQTVWVALFKNGKWYGMQGKIVNACGDGGRVVNEKHGYDRWVSRWDMRVKREASYDHAKDAGLLAWVLRRS